MSFRVAFAEQQCVGVEVDYSDGLRIRKRFVLEINFGLSHSHGVLEPVAFRGVVSVLLGDILCHSLRDSDRVCDAWP